MAEIETSVLRIGSNDLILQDAEARTKINEAYVTDTASGAIASFPDGAAMPVKSLTVDIEPVQDLHGQANPYPAGGGVNKLPPITAKQSASNGVTFKSNGDGTYSITGTASAGTTLDLTFDTPVSLSTGTYYVSFFNTAASGTIGFYAIGTSRNNLWDTTLGTANRTFTNTNIGNDSITALRCYVASGVNANVTLSPVVAVNAYSATFAPYENICPISGHTSATVTRTGKNLATKTIHGYVRVSDKKVLIDNDSESVVFYAESGKTYTVSSSATMGRSILGLASTDEITSGFQLDNAIELSGSVNTWTATWTGWTVWYKCSNAQSAFANSVQVEQGSTATAYESPNIQTVTIDLDGTRYGGSLDVGTGVLTVDRVIKTLNGSENWLENGALFYVDYTVLNGIKNNGRIMSNAYVSTTVPGSQMTVGQMKIAGANVNFKTSFASLAAWKSELSANNVQLVYELATPQTVQLTANELETVLGQNNIWNDCGDTEVEYRADTKLYIQKVINS